MNKETWYEFKDSTVKDKKILVSTYTVFGFIKFSDLNS